ncbi:hypothetical protein [Acaryochloris marina]|uniref:Uncharacterized protein n=1 Tax=Acaryochloris marina (strain MBIC 11017) TaxID=329726 RepID=B0CDJ5_ACAM1|nr:hypothetical protein [Acaryochloris marina]ABW28064.1 hypothetical protein AM1_3068 [Acaryochloris marina MBIC11017]BDM82774.1 hypothetical protein AM10699_56350 [Acaryochloris marina MBIC10699]
MTNQPLMPDPSVDQRLLDNLNRARLEIEELGLQLDGVLARFDEEIRQQRLKRIQKSSNRDNKQPLSP